MDLLDATDATLYDALLARDARYDGRAYVGVVTTGVFCRLTCPARKPLRENCRFFRTIADCVVAGFRPCQRCHPLAPAAAADPVVAAVMAAWGADRARRWTEADVAALGFDASTVRRAFRRQYGMTFLEFARASRLRDGFETLARDGRVVDAQAEAAFASPSGFRDAFARLIGVAPGGFTGGELLKADCIGTPIGPMIAVADQRALHLLEFVGRKALPTELRRLQHGVRGALGIGRFAPTEQVEAELRRYFAGEAARFDVPVAYHGSAFARRVWDALRDIPVGRTRSYAEVAAVIGVPSAVRAVARANGENALALVVPCHRVIGADGALTGYGGGLWRKRWLIDLERRIAGVMQGDRRGVAAGGDGSVASAGEGGGGESAG
jgi:AraC family transcriptional regulator of adaptative response/methylated-DNA-[protein]-cysteine methyltransferase